MPPVLAASRGSHTTMSIPRRRLSSIELAITAVLVVLVFTLPVTLPAPLHRRLVEAIGERFGGSAPHLRGENASPLRYSHHE